MPIRAKRFSGGGGSSLKASARSFLTTIAPGATIAQLSRPFGQGTVFSTVGGVPGQLALSAGAGAIVAGASAAADGQTYSLTVRAASADGSRAVEIALGFRALTPVVITGNPPAAMVGQPYEYVFPGTAPLQIGPADLAELATSNLSFDAPGRRLFSPEVRA
jgi:hypothetical protein